MGKILAQGGRLDSVVVTGGVVTEVATGGTFDATYADCALDCGSASNNHFELIFMADDGTPIDVVAGETCWSHFEVMDGGGGGNNLNIWELRDSAGFPWVAIKFTNISGQIMGLRYNSGTGAAPVWTAIGADMALGEGVRNAHDIRVVIGNGGPHFAEWCVGGTSRASGTFANAGFTTARKFRCIGQETNRFSQLLATEGIPTIGAKVKYSRPTGAGTTNTFTSAAAANVNEAVNSDLTLDQSAVAGQRVTYAMGDVAVPAGYKIAGVDHCMRGKNDGSAPTNLKSVVRSGGVDYPSAGNLQGIAAAFGPLRLRRPTDPNTGLEWGQAGWNAAEAGYESAA